MRPRLRALLVTTALVLALTGVGPAAAGTGHPHGEMPSPEATCSVLMPPALSISAPVTTFTLRLGDDCDPDTFGWARWTVRDPRTGRTVADLVSDDTDVPMSLRWRDDADGFGTFEVVPVAAFDVEMNPLAQNAPTFVVKARAKAGLVITRNRVSVTATASASYYSARHDRMIPWPGARVELQQASVAVGGRWTTAATLTTGAGGTATTSMWASSPRWWRVVTPATRSVHPSTTVPVFR